LIKSKQKSRPFQGSFYFAPLRKIARKYSFPALTLGLQKLLLFLMLIFAEKAKRNYEEIYSYYYKIIN
jgi:hypothetical protein